MEEFPDANLIPFGSFATKLYLPTGCVLANSTSQSFISNAMQS